jgi:hypothetical protein
MHIYIHAKRVAARLLPASVVLLALGTGCLGSCADNEARDANPWRPDAPQPECSRWDTACDGECVSTPTDPRHCGECGVACAAGQFCAGGNCVDECDDPYTLCDDECVRLSTSPTHCGECGNRCVVEGAYGHCSSGECRGWECDAYHYDTNGDPSDGCERVCEPLQVRDDERAEVELPLVHVDGSVTIDGAPVPAETPGFILFESLDTESMMHVPVAEDGSFSAVLYAGYYRIHRTEKNDCELDQNRCPNSVLREYVRIAQDRTLELDDDIPVVAPPIEVSGRIRVNGAEPPSNPEVHKRADIEFRNRDRRIVFEVGPQGPATFSGTIPAGEYSVTIKGRSCQYNELPCQNRQLEQEIELREDTEFDWDLNSVRLSGQITANGRDLSGSTTLDRFARLVMGPTDDTSKNGRHWIDIPAGESGRYSAWVYPGTYEFGIENQYACPAGLDETASREIPCAYELLDESVDVVSDVVLDYNLDVSRLTGEITVNGQSMPDSPAGISRGRIELVRGVSHPVDQVDLGSSGPARFDIPLYGDEYDIQIRRRIHNGAADSQERVLPAGRMTLEAVDVAHSPSLPIDLNVHELTGRITIDGAPFVAADDSTRVNLRPTEHYEPARWDLAPGEPAQFRFKVYDEHSYTIDVWESSCGDRERQRLPCGYRILATDLTLGHDDERTYDLSPKAVTGQLLINGEPPGQSGSIDDLLLRSEKGWLHPEVDVDADGRFEVRTYSDTYDVEYRHVPDRCEGPIPCGRHTLDEELDARQADTLVVDLPTAELQGDVSFDGRESSYPEASGLMVLEQGEYRYNVPVDDGAYGPARLIEGEYHRVYQQFTSEADYVREMCTFSGDVPCHAYRVDICQ